MVLRWDGASTSRPIPDFASLNPGYGVAGPRPAFLAPRRRRKKSDKPAGSLVGLAGCLPTTLGINRAYASLSAFALCRSDVLRSSLQHAECRGRAERLLLPSFRNGDGRTLADIQRQGLPRAMGLRLLRRVLRGLRVPDGHVLLDNDVPECFCSVGPAL
jgi:hypothetical protein